MKHKSDEIAVVDHGETIVLPFDDCIKYHGRDSIGGLALGFRLLQLAFSDLSPEKVPDRTSISFATSFAGPGLRDSVELVTRAVTRGAYRVVDAAIASQTAPESPAGPLWFEITIGGRAASYEVVPGAVGPEFVRLGKLSRSGALSEEERPSWTAQKQALAKAVLAGMPGEYLLRLS